MNAIEARAMLATAPQSDTKPARVNKLWTQAQAVTLIRERINEYPAEYVLTPIMEKRVLQVCQNRKCPTANAAAHGGDERSLP